MLTSHEEKVVRVLLMVVFLQNMSQSRSWAAVRKRCSQWGRKREFQGVSLSFTKLGSKYFLLRSTQSHSSLLGFKKIFS